MQRVVRPLFPERLQIRRATAARCAHRAVVSVASVVALAALAALVGCGGAGTGSPDANGNPAAPTQAQAEGAPLAGERSGPVRAIDDLRIVSLSPALSQVLLDLGLGDRIVGRTPFCDALPDAIPIVGSLLDVDYERLLTIAPTHLVVQPAASGTDPELERLAVANGWILIEQGLDRLEDVAVFVDALPAGLQIDAADGSEAAEALAALGERARTAAARLRALIVPADAAAGPAPVRTLLLVGTDPPTAAGRATFVDEMLVAAGGVNAVEAEGYPELTLEDIVGLDPERILVLREVPPGPSEADLVLAPLRSTVTRAARIGAVRFFVDASVMLPSTQAPAVVERLRDALREMGVATEAVGGR